MAPKLKLTRLYWVISLRLLLIDAFILIYTNQLIAFCSLLDKF